MNKSKAIGRINSTYSRLAGCFEHTEKWDRYVALIEEEERAHRRFCRSGVSCGLTRSQAVRLFAIKEVFDRWIRNESGKIFTPTAKDFFSIRGSVFGACAIADLCGDQILKEFPLPKVA